MQTVLYIAVIAYRSLWSVYTLCIAKVCVTYMLVLFALCIFNWLAFEKVQMSSHTLCSCPLLNALVFIFLTWEKKRHFNQVHPLHAVLCFMCILLPCTLNLIKCIHCMQYFVLCASMYFECVQKYWHWPRCTKTKKKTFPSLTKPNFDIRLIPQYPNLCLMKLAVRAITAYLIGWRS